MSQQIIGYQAFPPSAAWGGAATQTSSSVDTANANEITFLMSFGLPVGVSTSNYTYVEVLESESAISSSTPSSEALLYGASNVLYLPSNFSWSGITDRRSTEVLRINSTAVYTKLYKLAIVPRKRYVGMRLVRVGSAQTLTLSFVIMLGRLNRTPTSF